MYLCNPHCKTSPPKWSQHTLEQHKSNSRSMILDLRTTWCSWGSIPIPQNPSWNQDGIILYFSSNYLCIGVHTILQARCWKLNMMLCKNMGKPLGWKQDAIVIVWALVSLGYGLLSFIKVDPLCEFPNRLFPNYQKFNGLKQNTFIILQSCRSEVQNRSYQAKIKQ